MSNPDALCNIRVFGRKLAESFFQRARSEHGVAADKELCPRFHLILPSLQLVGQVQCIDYVLFWRETEVVRRYLFIGCCLPTIRVIVVHAQRVHVSFTLIIDWSVLAVIRVRWERRKFVAKVHRDWSANHVRGSPALCHVRLQRVLVLGDKLNRRRQGSHKPLVDRRRDV